MKFQKLRIPHNNVGDLFLPYEERQFELILILQVIKRPLKKYSAMLLLQAYTVVVAGFYDRTDLLIMLHIWQRFMSCDLGGQIILWNYAECSSSQS
ncbi:hypothetical protein TNCV_499971 [Trichonephila clavipes]|nr:hypothetical protein TNCV_499971 [Trichonephila clavipes]